MHTPESSGPADNPQRVLIADADPESAARAQAMLTAAGYDVAVATSGPEALHFTDADAPDLYLLDRDLPELDGLRVARYLHRSYQIPVSRIVVLDSSAPNTYFHPEVKALIMRKPFTGVELLLTVMRQLEQVGQALVLKVPRPRGRPRKIR
jgi:two-component system response regulator RegX3